MGVWGLSGMAVERSCDHCAEQGPQVYGTGDAMDCTAGTGAGTATDRQRWTDHSDAGGERVWVVWRRSCLYGADSQGAGRCGIYAVAALYGGRTRGGAEWLSAGITSRDQLW